MSKMIDSVVSSFPKVGQHVALIFSPFLVLHVVFLAVRRMVTVREWQAMRQQLHMLLTFSGGCKAWSI